MPKLDSLKSFRACGGLRQVGRSPAVPMPKTTDAIFWTSEDGMLIVQPIFVQPLVPFRLPSSLIVWNQDSLMTREFEGNVQEAMDMALLMGTPFRNDRKEL